MKKINREERLKWAREAADFLYREGAHEVWLFGSLAKGRRQDFRSDIDLAVEALPSDKYLYCLGTLLDLAPASVDLVELEKASPILRGQIFEHGILLHREL